ncbi:serine/threonine-protein kinase [Agromyces sp. NPDC060279]|uniref:serine/threonine-protein kinase n=1 Tax=Agromyces sp. NPDC060279 TaxID=3347092 RepID=UPI003664A090
MRRQPSTPPELPGYQYVDLLGSGGFADVFLYEQRLPRRRVAVKVLVADELSRDTRAQFVAEANLMAQLSAHPYIVTIFHADVAADGRPYFVMEYCSGPSLAAQLKREPFQVDAALRTGIRLASAVATAHAAGILHRDIKPANVLTNDYGWPALTDFGISSTLEGELPVHTMTFLGGGADSGSTGGAQSAIGLSVPWSPPELFDDDPRPDTRSDVYALAATVHTLLAGRSPFELPGRPNGSLDLIGRIERGAITPIDRDDVPQTLQSVLRRGMAVRREERYASAVEFARALQRVELELGYAATAIEVPTQLLAAAAAEPEPVDDGADATRARVASIQAQPTAPDPDATRARGPVTVQPQPQPQPQPRTPSMPGPAAPAEEQTLIRPRGVQQADASHRPAPSAAPFPGPPASTAAPAAPSEQPRRSRLGLVIGIAATLVVVAAVGVAVALSGQLAGPPEASAPPAVDTEDAIAGAQVPSPVVGDGVVSADGTAVTFEVSHDDAADGDRYRWRLADGSGSPAVADGPEIVVSPVTPGQRICIDVQVQRGSKTSESVRGCTA